MHEIPGGICVLDTVRDIARAMLANGSERDLWEVLDGMLELIDEPARSRWHDQLTEAVAHLSDDAISTIYWAHDGGIRIEAAPVEHSII